MRVVGRAISNLDVGGRAHTDNVQDSLSAIPASAWFASSTTFVLGHVGDREDSPRRHPRSASKRIPTLRTSGKRLRGSTLEILVVVAESILGSKITSSDP